MENKLPEPFKSEWIAALRSGKYKQAEGVLYDETIEGFCCLGLAEYICGTPLESLINKQMPHELSHPNSPELLQETWQFTNDGSLPKEPNEVMILASMNDGIGHSDRKYTFEEIADFIEKEL